MEHSTFGYRLAQARRERGVREGRDISPSDIAREMDVTPKTVYTWERDANTPPTATLARLADLVGVTPGWLLFGQEPKFPTAPAVTGDRAKGVQDFQRWSAEAQARKQAAKRPKKRRRN